MDAAMVAHGMRIVDYERRMDLALRDMNRDAVPDEKGPALPALDADAALILSPTFLEEPGEALATTHVGRPKIRERPTELPRQLPKCRASVEVRAFLRARNQGGCDGR